MFEIRLTKFKNDFFILNFIIKIKKYEKKKLNIIKINNKFIYLVTCKKKILKNDFLIFYFIMKKVQYNYNK